MIPVPFHPTVNLFGALQVSPHAILLPVAFIVYFYLISRHSKEVGKHLWMYVGLTVGLSLLGGRIGHVLMNGWQWPHWYDFFIPVYGGWVSYGVLVGGVIGVFLSVIFDFRRDRALHFARIADVFAFYLPVWIIIYRLGCFVRNCCYGKETDLWWGVQYVGTEIVRHPTQVYSILNAIVIFGILWLFFRYEKTEKTRFGKRFDGEVALWFLLLYCVGRFVIDFFRFYPEGQSFGGLVVSQWVCLGVFFWICISLALTYKGLVYYNIYTYKQLRTFITKSHFTNLGYQYMKKLIKN